MLNHQNQEPVSPKRVVLIGGASFIGSAVAQQLEGKTTVLSLGRANVDLTADGAANKLAGFLKADDAVVAISAQAPCRNVDDFLVNAEIIKTLTKALEQQPVAHLVNISSDAVYPDEPVPLSEAVPAAPTSMHGAMHLAREIALRGLSIPMATLRPTLVYGDSDPHNGYGPNQFRRKANKNEPITLFGEGEERRDHVLVDDVAELVVRVLFSGSTGVLNAATGTVTTFKEVAEKAVTLSGQTVEINGSPRKGPMPHNGYRPFDPVETTQAFPDFSYTTLDDGMKQAQTTEFGNG